MVALPFPRIRLFRDGICGAVGPKWSPLSEMCFGGQGAGVNIRSGGGGHGDSRSCLPSWNRRRDGV